MKDLFALWRGKRRAARFLAASLLLMAACSPSNPPMPTGLASPDSTLQVALECANGSGQGSFGFKILHQGTPLSIDVELGLRTAGRLWNDNVRLVEAGECRAINDDYTMLSGKRSHCTNRGNEWLLLFANDRADTLGVRLRLYDDGIAFRYECSAADTLRHELTTYKVPEGLNRWTQKYDPLSYEGYYPYSNSALPADGDSRVAIPALLQPGESLFALVTEAGLSRGHCASYLTAGDQSYTVTLADTLSPMGTDWHSPWRLMIVGTPARVVESTLVTDVSEPCKLADTGWIEPGPASWVYWAYNHGSKDYRIVKEYTDLAADMGWPYVLIDWEWDVMSNGGNVADAVRYAAKKGVKPLLWYNSSTSWIGQGAPQPLFRLNTKEAREREYSWLKELGVQGVKVDFFSGDDGRIINYFIDLLEDAARHRLLVTLHGATVPRGWQRTYPNLMTVEGVRGAEWYNNGAEFGPKAASHNATLPFTRNVVGPMDYTPGTFSDSQHPHFTTHGHELALYILFESTIQHMPDRPDIYRSLPAPVRRLLSELPTCWDDTKFLGGYPGEWVAIARKRGDSWWIAAINGSDQPAELTVDLSPLGIGEGELTLFADGDEPRSFAISAPAYSPTLAVSCLARGGFAATLSPKR